MIELSRAVVIDDKDLLIDKNTTIYPFTLSSFKKAITFYALKRTEKEKWMHSQRSNWLFKHS